MIDLVTSVDFNILRILFATSMLLIATVFDAKKREVHDLLWVIFGVMAVILVIPELQNIDMLIQIGISVGIVFPISLLLWRIGLFGGADAFAIIVLAGLVPFATLSESQVTPLTTLLNASLLSVIILPINAIRNLYGICTKQKIFDGFDESRCRKIIACFIGTKQTSPQHSFSIQKNIGNIKKFDFALSHAENTDFCKSNHTWVTPGIPFFLYITLGFMIQIFFGDVFFSSIVSLLNL